MADQTEDDASSYEGPERRHQPPLLAAFEAGIQEAAARAAQQVAAIHRRRLVTQSFLAALAASLLVAIAGLAIVQHNERDFARRNSLYNCRLFAMASGAMSDFVRSEAGLRDRQSRSGLDREVAAGFAKIIRPATLLRLIKHQQQDTAVAVARWRKDAQILQAVAGTDCPARLGG